MTLLPLGAAPLDLAALALFLACWLGYERALAWLDRRHGTLNGEMIRIRRAWMLRMAGRDNRITDAALIGHTIHSASFFASASVLVLAGLLGLLGNLDRLTVVLARPPLDIHDPGALVEAKLVLLLATFVYGFFKFTWSIRQFNYTIAMIGAMPPPPVPEPVLSSAVEATADLLTLAAQTFNAGVRAYYFALAALAWFTGPLPFAAGTVWMTGILLYRQLGSRALASLRREARTLGLTPSPRSDPNGENR